MTAIINYGVGNLFSLRSSFEFIGEQVVVTDDAKTIASADRVILPGVGAFEDATRKLRESGMSAVVKEQAASGKPLLGICLGMQLLFDKSFEYGEHEGLGLIPGEVVPIAPVVPKDYKIPHIGWNALSLRGQNNPLLKYTKEGAHVYFVHSFYASNCAEDTIAVTEYGAELTAAVARKNVLGTQFHPEKSGETGLAMLKAFCEI